MARKLMIEVSEDQARSILGLLTSGTRMVEGVNLAVTLATALAQLDQEGAKAAPVVGSRVPPSCKALGPGITRDDVATVAAYLWDPAPGSWTTTYADGRKKAGPTSKEIQAATGLSPERVGPALAAMLTDLKIAGVKAGTTYRLKP